MTVGGVVDLQAGGAGRRALIFGRASGLRERAGRASKHHRAVVYSLTAPLHGGVSRETGSRAGAGGLTGISGVNGRGELYKY